MARPHREGATPRPARRATGRLPVMRHAITPVAVEASEDATLQRAMLADYLRLVAWWLGRPPMPTLTPRLELAMRALLAGDAEKQVAARLGVSIHTAHAYVKEIYRRAGVTSRGELLTRFLPTLANGTARAAPPLVRRPD